MFIGILLYSPFADGFYIACQQCLEPRKISWTWNLWKIWAKKTNNHSPIMAIVLIKSDSAGFFVQIYSQNHGAISPHQMGEKNKIDYI